MKKEDETSENGSPEDGQEDEDEDKKNDVANNACGNDKKKYSYTDDEIDSLLSELESLKAFKLSIENKEKDALIAKLVEEGIISQAASSQYLRRL